MPPSASCSSASRRSQDQAAFRTLYGNYYQRLSRLLARMSVRREDIEEVINDTFWVVWTKAGEFRGASQLSTWIIGIAYRRALERAAPREDAPGLRRTLRRGFHQRGVHRRRARPIGQWLSLGLTRLPVEQRMALELTYTLGHSCEEVAAILDCPVNTVKTRLFRARETLKQVLPASQACPEKTHELAHPRYARRSLGPAALARQRPHRASDREWVEAHVAGCAECRAELAAQRMMATRR